MFLGNLYLSSQEVTLSRWQQMPPAVLECRYPARAKDGTHHDELTPTRRLQQ